MFVIMDTYRKILTKYWGYTTFRPMQEEIIESAATGNDTLVLMPTGGGKTLTFQVPAMSKEGICLVITPLIALMKDQCESLKKKQIKALAIHAGLTRDEIDIALNNAIFGDFKFLYCSPERVNTAIFRERFFQMKINLIVIDEAHCISQWGYDFRPSYMQLVKLREMKPEVPVMALTASATPEVIDDIQNKLLLRECKIFRMSYERKNLVYVVRNAEDKLGYLVKLLQSIQGTGIVYVRNRQKTKEISVHLQKNNISSDFYHAGLTDEIRSQKQQEWFNGKVRVIVSTNAFGMGIDKADVRFVVHFDLPDSIESYYQEAGRGGRDEKKAYAIQLFNRNDELSARKRLETNFPDISEIKQVYGFLGNFLQVPIGGGKFLAYDFQLQDFAAKYKVSIQSAFSCIKVLEQEGYIEFSEDLNTPSRVHFIIARDDLYKFQVANQQFDDFIKLLLRSYTGMFSDYVPIDETMLAKRSNTTQDVVYKYLVTLSKLKVISYIPRRNNPVIVYTEERLDDKTLYISHAEYNKRKERYEGKVNAMLSYAKADHKCRSQIILTYFGEKNPYRCGQCDNCQQRNELGLSQYEFDLILTEVKKLANSTLNGNELLEQLTKIFPDKKCVEVYRWLLDNDKLHINAQDKVEWKH